MNKRLLIAAVGCVLAVCNVREASAWHAGKSTKISWTASFGVGAKSQKVDVKTTTKGGQKISGKVTSIGANPLITTASSYTQTGGVKWHKALQGLTVVAALNTEIARLANLRLEGAAATYIPTANAGEGNGLARSLFIDFGASSGAAPAAAAAAVVLPIAAGGLALVANGGVAGGVALIRNAVMHIAGCLESLGIKVGYAAAGAPAGAPVPLIDANGVDIVVVGGNVGLGGTLSIQFKEGDSWLPIMLPHAAAPGTNPWFLAAGGAADVNAIVRFRRLNGTVAQLIKALEKVRKEFTERIVNPALEEAGIRVGATSVLNTSADGNVNLIVDPKSQAGIVDVVQGISKLAGEWGQSIYTDAANLGPAVAGFPAKLVGCGWNVAIGGGSPYVVLNNGAAGAIAAGESIADANPAGTFAAGAGAVINSVRKTIYGMAKDLQKLGLEVYAGSEKYDNADRIGMSIAGAGSSLVITTPVSVVIPGSEEKITIIAADTDTFEEAVANNERLAVNRINTIVGICNTALNKLQRGIWERIPEADRTAKISDSLVNKDPGVLVKVGSDTTLLDLQSATIIHTAHKNFAFGQASIGVQGLFGKTIFAAFDLTATYSGAKIPINEHTIDGVSTISKSKVHSVGEGQSIVYNEEVPASTAGTIEVREKFGGSAELKVGGMVVNNIALYAGFGVTYTGREFKHTPDKTDYDGVVKYIKDVSANLNSISGATDVHLTDASDSPRKEFSSTKGKFGLNFIAGARVFAGCDNRFFVDVGIRKHLNETTKYETPAYFTNIVHDPYSGGATHEVKAHSALSFIITVGTNISAITSSGG
jgi:hypothetical protein